LFGPYVANSGYRSTESLAGDVSGAQGWNPSTSSGYGIYPSTRVPEPLATLPTLALVALALCGTWRYQRRKTV
jgi:hypothetical protein